MIYYNDKVLIAKRSTGIIIYVDILRK